MKTPRRVELPAGLDTYPHREVIRERGGRWDAAKRVWMVPGDTLDYLVALCSITQEREAEMAAYRAQKAAEALAASEAAQRDRERKIALARARADAEIAAMDKLLPMIKSATEFEVVAGKTVLGVSDSDARKRLPIRAYALLDDDLRIEITSAIKIDTTTATGRTRLHTASIPRLPVAVEVDVYRNSGYRRVVIDATH